MGRVGAILVATAATVSVAGLFSGCADNESTLFIKGVMKPDEGTCTYRPDATSVLLLGGVLDTAFGGSYMAGLLVGNQMKSQGNKDRNRTETSRILLEGAVVSLRRSNGGVISEFSAPGVGFVDPSSGDAAAFGVVSVLVVPDAAEVVGEAYVVADIQVYGHSLGGQEVESNVFSFPIDICDGCLVSFPQSSINPTTGECQATESTSGVLPCYFGQDEIILCSDCAAAFPDACLSPA
jgi:hypothetical protein